MNFRNLLFTVCLTILGTYGLQAQCLEGQAFDIRITEDGIQNTNFNDWAVVGPGVEFNTYYDLFDIDITDGMVSIMYTGGAPSVIGEELDIQLFETTFAANGIILLSATADPSKTLVPSVSGSGSTISIVFPAGTVLDPGDMAKINVVAIGCDANPIPSMGQWALMILGLLMTSLAVVKIYKHEKTIA